MAGGVAAALAAASRAAHASSTASSGCSRSTSSGSARSSRSCEPRALLLANLFRDQLDRYGELETIADRWAAVVAAPAGDGARAQRRRPARRRPRPRAGARCTSASRTTASPTPSSSTPRTPSTAGTAGTPTSTTPPTWRTSAATIARTAATAAPILPWSRARPAARDPLGRLHARARRKAPRAWSCRYPGSTTSTTRSAPPRFASRSGSSCRDRCWPRRRRARLRARRDDRPRRPLDLRSCWSRTRRARTRSCARSRSRAARSTSFGVLNDCIADGRDVSWVWDADWETARAARPRA